MYRPTQEATTMMHHIKLSTDSIVLLLFFGLAMVVSQAQAGAQAGQMPSGVQAMKAANGTMVLADTKGMTLYTYAKDMPGASNCNDNCAKNWPPLMASADAKPMGGFTVVTRADGSKQWAYKGMPLYTWVKDMKPGETSGDGVGGAWKIAAP
jgi:predicted lipoprotein with Yx(FWY)xxD motif